MNVAQVSLGLFRAMFSHCSHPFLDGNQRVIDCLQKDVATCDNLKKRIECDLIIKM